MLGLFPRVTREAVSSCGMPLGVLPATTSGEPLRLTGTLGGQLKPLPLGYDKRHKEGQRNGWAGEERERWKLRA